MSILRFLRGVVLLGGLAFSGATVLAGELSSIDHLMTKVRARGFAGLPKHHCSPDCSAKIPLHALLDDTAQGAKSANLDYADLYLVEGTPGGISQVVLRADGRYYDALRQFVFKAIGRPTVSGERVVCRPIRDQRLQGQI